MNFMSNVISFAERQEQRQEQQKEQLELQEHEEFFSWLLPLLSQSQLIDLRLAVETNDQELWNNITQPIIRREAMRIHNKGL